jgi:hypothetical protein
MKHRIANEPRSAERHLPPNKPDASGIGVNYANAYLAALKVTLEDGRKVSAKRRGLEISLRLGERSGSALMRRIEHGPDAQMILVRALEGAAADAGLGFKVEDGALYLIE